MFIVHHAANQKILLRNLITVIEQQPLQAVFTKEWFLIENQGMEYWLSQQLAQHFNVWAHYQFSLPSQFFKQLAQKINTSLSGSWLDYDTMLWSIEQQLHQLDEPIYAALKHYLQGDNILLKRYQLATEIATLFEKYQLFRPQLLSAWQHQPYLCKYEAEHWQRALWLQISKTSPSATLINTLTQAKVGYFKYQLPERLFIFGVSHLPPRYLDYLHALARHCQVHFYLKSPFLILNRSKYRPSHPLIASLGQQGQAFQQLLKDRVQFELQYNATQTPRLQTNLQQLQYHIIQPTTQRIALTVDHSISIHACHSRVREIEVLKNVLLQYLEKNPKVNLRDIAVVAPDIQHYAPFISSVFDGIPHNMHRAQLQEENTVFNVFITFLQLITSRFEWQAVLDLLAHPSIFPQFDLVSADLITVKHWLMATQVRWGKSAEHKQQFGLPPLDENTWQASLNRLLMGYAVATDSAFVDQCLPYPEIEGSSAQTLGGFYDFIQLLFKASEQLTGARSFQQWGQHLHEYAQLLFTNKTKTQTLYSLFSTMENRSQSTDQRIELTVIIHWLEDWVTRQPITTPLLRGHLNFSSMDAVRGIPFKVIAILGMNEGEFPSIDRPPRFDLLTIEPKLGDPSKRMNDRQQFLELLLATEQQLIVSYIGQSQHQPQDLSPSVIISEWLEVMAVDYQLTELLIKHPLQPFSYRYFENSHSSLFSYSTLNAEIAHGLAQPPTTLQNSWLPVINVTPNKVIELEEMRHFYRHPQRYFMRRQLGVNFQGLAPIVEPREPFSIKPLEAYSIHHQWIKCLLAQGDFSLTKLQAQGRWLSGVVGRVEFNKQQPAIIKFVTEIQALALGDGLENLAIDRIVGRSRIIGKLDHRYQQGSLFYRYAALKGKDLMLALLHHCLINQHQPQSTYLVSQDYSLQLTPEHQSPALLEALLTLYFKGIAKPNVLFVDIGLDYVKQADQLAISSRRQKTALAVATDKLSLCLATDYELELQRLYKNSEDLTQVFSNDFIDFCEQLLKPLWIDLMKQVRLKTK
jgi:exodeoxyribonuclease V gamma subunit